MSKLNGTQSSSKVLHKPNKRLACTLAILTAQLFCSVTLPQSNTVAQSAANASIQKRKPPKQKSILEAILDIVSRKKSPGSSRTTSQFCPIAPAVLETKNVIWSDRPLFAWRGKISSLQVRPYVADTLFEDQSLLWEPKADELQQGAVYAKTSLQPGQRYDWQVIYGLEGGDKPIKLRRTYQVMASPQRDRISTALQTLESQLKSDGATGDEVTLARAKYFLEQDLWSDAFQQIYPIRHHSPEMMQLSRAVGDRACQPESINQANLEVGGSSSSK
jgi:hypothetical protein